MDYLRPPLLPSFPRDFVSRQKFAREDLSHLPLSIRKAIDESGILDQWGTNFSWLKDERAIKALAYAEKSHGGQIRKNGSESRLIHEIWCAHQIYNIGVLNGWLKNQGHDPLTGVFCMLVHDCVENFRELAEKKGTSFNPETVISDIADIWSNPATFPFIKEQSIDYMTDAPGTSGQDRIEAQAAKSYDEHGIFRLSVLQQCLRMYDKLSHVYFDARNCEREYNKARTRAAQKAEIGIRKAEMKVYPLQFPLGYMVLAPYRRSMRVLKTIAEEKPRHFHGAMMDHFIDNALCVANWATTSSRSHTVNADPNWSRKFLMGCLL